MKGNVLVMCLRLSILLFILSLIQMVECSELVDNTVNPSNRTESTLSREIESAEDKKLPPHLRKRRYVVFPEGSSFSTAVCMTIGMLGNPNYQLFSWALNWGIAYELPNQTWALALRHRNDPKDLEMSKPAVQRRHRRDLYNRLELAMNDMGYNGRECVLRAVCESPQFFRAKGTNLVQELLRSIFSLPRTKILPFEDNQLIHYNEAHRRGRNLNTYCPSLYPNCGFSLLELALGRYTRPFQSYL